MTATLIEPVARLIEAFARLPGIGPKTAQRLTYHLLRTPETEVRGTAGGGVVEAVVTGKQELRTITIDPSAVDPADVEMLQDLVVAAVNDALESSRQIAEQKMSAVTGGMAGGLGGLLGR